MALASDVVPVTFTKGLDTHSQRKLVVPGKWDWLINATLSEDGSIRRRDGYETLLSGQAGTGLATRDNELLVINGPDVSTVSEASTNLAKQVNGQHPFVDVSKSEVDFTPGFHDSLDMAYGNGFACYVWRDRTSGMTVNGLYCSVVDETSGAKVVARHQLSSVATSVSPRVVFADNAFFIFYIEPAVGNALMCNVIATSAPSTVGTQTSLVGSASLPIENIDACVETLLGIPAVAYRWTDGATSVRAIEVSRTGTTPAIAAGPLNVITEAEVNEATIHAIAIAPYSSAKLGVFVVHTAGGAVAAGCVGAVIDTTAGGFSVSTAAALVDAQVPAATSDTHVTATQIGSGLQVFWDQQGSYLSATIQPIRTTVRSTTLGATVAAYTVLRSACFRLNNAEAAGPQGPFICGKAFTYGGGAFLPVCILENWYRPSGALFGVTAADSLSAQCSFWLLDCSDTTAQGVTVAGALYGTFGLVDTTLGGSAPPVQTPCSTPAIGDGFGILVPERGRTDIVSGINATAVGASRLTLTPQTRPPSKTQLGELAYFSGGQLGQYDGKQVVSSVFPMYPEGINVTRVNTGGAAGKLTVGVHQVCAVYEWTDGSGNRVQSAPSLPVSVTVQLDTDTITVLVPTTQLAQSSGYNTSISTLNVICYMTAASGLTFYRVVNTFTTPDVNTPTASTVTVNIGLNQVMPDARLTQNELLYTQPNQAGTRLPNTQPGPLHGIGVSQNRLWGFLSDEPGEFMFSQEPIQNTGLQFNPDSLGGRLPSEAGAGVMIQALDEKTILFAERGLYVVFGTGPNAAGANNNFSDPQRIPADVGCSEARSVIEIPSGLMFKSEKGMYLLRRDLSVQYIGAGVARWDQYPISSAVMMGDRQEVRFTSDDEDGPTLVYSYEVTDSDGIGQWSVFYGGADPGLVTDAVWWPATERYVHLQASASAYPGLMQDTPGVYTDGAGHGSSSPTLALMYARTGWLHVSALEGFQRVRRLYLTATSEAAPTTRFVISVDFDDMYDGDADGAYSVTIDLSTITFDNVAAIDLRHHLARQKCKSVAFSFLDGDANLAVKVPLTGLQAMSLEVGRKRGVNKLPSTQTVG